MSSSDHTGQQLGAYRHTRLLGRGPSGNVYLSEHKSFNKQVAIKVLRTLPTTVDQKIFWNEVVRSTSLLIHPYIVHVLEVIWVDDIFYIVMDYAPGGSLRQRHPKGTQVSLPVVISYVMQVAAALQYAHNLQVIHCAVKPENMLLGSDDQILLTDFVTGVTSRSSSVEEVGGTITYAAPEQLAGKPSPASDQYALAATVYEWLCGEPPFQGAPVEVAQQHLFSPPSPLQAKNPAIPHAIEAVILRALAKDPTERFENVQDFAMALALANKIVGTPSIGSTLSENQRERLALSVLSKPFLLPKVYSSFYNALGKALSILGFNNKALMAYESAILLDSHRPQAYVRKGEVLFNLKRYKEALAAFDEAIRLAPESSSAYQGRGKTYGQLAEQSYDEFKQLAQQSYEKAKELGME